MANTLLDLVYSMGSCLACFPSTPQLKINGRSFKILRLLGEGGFSYVYLVQDTASAALYALKNIRCPFGAESVALAMREVEAYRLFAHTDGIIHSVDDCVQTDRGGGGGSSGGIGGDSGPAKTVYILLPYYRRGSLQDQINANLVNHAHFPERRLLRLFLGVCRALRGMHQFRGGDGTRAGPVAAGAAGARPGSTADERMQIGGGGDDDDHAAANNTARTAAPRGGDRAAAGADDAFEAEQQRPLMAGEALGAERNGRGTGPVTRSYAHRDIKPANIMLDDDGATPVLMDLGSLAASPLAITSRSLAIATQDTAAEHSTMPYRAPELFDVKTGAVIDTKVDIWSLGCTLYACLVGKSPFERRSDETGGSLALCVLGGDWRFPDEGPGAPVRRTNTGGAGAGAGAGAGGGGVDSQAPPPAAPAISEPVREIVRQCLQVEPAERPDIDGLISLVEDALAQLEA